MQIAALQINPLVGAPIQNFLRLESMIRANLTRAELFVTPELALIGYPPRDLLAYPALLKEEENQLEKIRLLSEELQIGILVGHTHKNPKTTGKPLQNCASLFDSGVLVSRTVKCRLPAYNIFTEERFFEPGTLPQPVVNFRGIRLGISICEDSWNRVLAFGRQDVRAYTETSNPVRHHAESELEINLSASPYSVGKIASRQDLFRATAMREKKTILYCTSVGAQDDILFDGGSFVVSSDGNFLTQAKRFEEDVMTFNTKQSLDMSEESHMSACSDVYEEITNALSMGLRDYVYKNGFQSVLLGISGGIDSALCAYLACRALGANNVYGVALPSALSSTESIELARDLAERLKFHFSEHSISASVDSFTKELQLENFGLPFENLQSRARGMMLMTLSNRDGHLLLTTSNKSELAMGYGTLYGDMCGALNPLGDLFKTEVFALCHHANIMAARKNQKTPIPYAICLRDPTAELAPNQKDSDALPNYEILDIVLEDFIENNGCMRFKNYTKILGDRHSLETLNSRFHAQEFKRYQSPPILKVKIRSFGSGWQLPLSKGPQFRSISPFSRDSA